MFKYEELQSVHVEITNRCQASCPMCLRNYHGEIKNPLLKLADWSLHDFQQIFNNKTLEIINRIEFCGNYGDPLLNKDLHLMTEHVKNYNIFVDIHTNGSLKTLKFWKNFVNYLPNHRVVFGIDGLADTHSMYRRGTDFSKIIKNAQEFIDAGGNAEWSFIKFKHNEHQVDEARFLAEKIGFSKFYTKDSSRFSFEKYFSVYDKKENLLYDLEPPADNKIKYFDPRNLQNLEQIIEKSAVKCYAKHKQEIYIDAYKKIMPCCFLAATPYDYTRSHDSLNSAKKRITEQYKQLILELGNTDAMLGIENVVNSNKFQTVWKKYWTVNKLWMCARICGTMFDKPNEQVNSI